MTLIGEFVYCSRCRRIKKLADTVPCELTGRWVCLPCHEGKAVVRA